MLLVVANGFVFAFIGFVVWYVSVWCLYVKQWRSMMCNADVFPCCIVELLIGCCSCPKDDITCIPSDTDCFQSSFSIRLCYYIFLSTYCCETADVFSGLLMLTIIFWGNNVVWLVPISESYKFYHDHVKPMFKRKYTCVTDITVLCSCLYPIISDGEWCIEIFISLHVMLAVGALFMSTYSLHVFLVKLHKKIANLVIQHACSDFGSLLRVTCKFFTMCLIYLFFQADLERFYHRCL